MKASPVLVAAPALVLFVAGGVFAQIFVSVSGTVGSVSGIRNEPYSAVRATETVQTLADGTHVTTRAGDQKIYRDSEGRTRNENYPPTNVINEDPSIPSMIIIHDPVARVTYTLNPRTHVAQEQHDSAVPPTPLPKRPVTVNPSEPPPIRMTTEKLGTQTIEGVLAEGVRNTGTIPVGARGNDRPLEVSTESWFSNELQDIVLLKTSDPRIGERTERLTNIDRSEPDPALFQVPADYTIRESPQ